MNNNLSEISRSLSDIVLAAGELNSKSYVWGGFVQDIIEGKIIREHNDVDMFIENMDTNIDVLEKSLKNKNFSCSYHADFQMLKLERNNVRTTINPVTFINETAFWKHIGDHGFICFPKDWLDTEYREFFDTKVITSGFKFEYCVRTIIKYTNPNWTSRIRDKDIQAMEYYEKMLSENHIKREELLANIWSYNPYWLKDGYNGYEAPVLVMGKDYI